MIRFAHLAAALATALVSACSTSALAEDYDVSPAVGLGNQIVTNAFADATEELVDNVRIFAYAFGEIDGQPYFLPDPGFHPLPGSGFAEGSRIGIELAAPLQYWSGSGTPSFAAVGAGETIRFGYGPDAVVSSGGPVPAPAGFKFVEADATGEADDHLDTFLLAPVVPSEGIYLATLRLTSDMPGVAASEPLYWLFSNARTQQQLADATLFVRDTFAPTSAVTLPEPAALLAFGGWALYAVSRRRSGG